MSRRLWPLAALAVIAVIAAGCGNGSAGTGRGGNSTTAGHNSTATPREKAVKFAECMRANGVGAFPDPDASGGLTADRVLNGSSIDSGGAAWKTAIGACKDLEPPGFTGHERNAQEQEGALEFAHASATTACRTSRTPPKISP